MKLSHLPCGRDTVAGSRHSPSSGAGAKEHEGGGVSAEAEEVSEDCGQDVRSLGREGGGMCQGLQEAASLA